MATNHADASGLTSSNPWAGVDGDGATELALAAPSQGQDAVRRLGSPTHVGCCPTGTLEVTSAASKKECGNAIEATVAALTRNLSTTPPKFLILSGSLRPESYSRKLAVECGRLLANYGCEAKVYDATGLPLFCAGGDDASHPKVLELRALTRWAEGMVWVSPEIHGCVSGVFKNQIDWIPLSEGAVRPTQGKTLAVMQVEAGSQSFNTVNILRVLGRWMRMVVVPNQASVPRAYEAFDDAGSLKPGSARSRVVDVIDELFKFTLLLRDQTSYLTTRYSERLSAVEKALKETAAPASAEVLRGLRDPIILDVRSAKERDNAVGGAAIPSSVHVPLNVDGQPQSAHETSVEEFRGKLEGVEALNFDVLDRSSRAFICHCAHPGVEGGRGARAAALLRVMGFKNAHNGGHADAVREAFPNGGARP